MSRNPIRISPGTVIFLLAVFVCVWGAFVCEGRRYFIFYDQADVALVARNLLRGNGLTTDAMWMWVRDYGSAHHPEDTWPPLQSVLVAGAMLIFGQTVAATHVVTIAFFVALIVSVYMIGKRLFGPWEGVIAAIMVSASPQVYSLAAVGSNDIGAAFFYMAGMYAIYRSFGEDSGFRWTALAVLLTGLSIYQKFQGVLLVISYIAWQMVVLRTAPRRVLSKSLQYFCLLTLVGLPFIIRNWYAFGQITLPSSSIVNAIGTAWDPMVERWRMFMTYYLPYWKHEVPSYGYLIEHRGAWYFFVDRPIYEIKRLLGLALSFNLIPMTVCLYGMFGAFIAFAKRPRWVKWNAVVAFCSISYVLFCQMETRYFVIFVPMAAIFAGYFVIWFWNRLKAASIAAAIVFLLISGATLAQYARMYILLTADNYNYNTQVPLDFLRKTLKPNEGVMAYEAAIWAFGTDHYSVSPPNVDLAEFIEMADRYKQRYMVIELAKGMYNTFARPGSQYMTQRLLAPLYKGREVYGFKLVFNYRDETYIYRIPRPDEIDLKTLPKLPPEPDDFTRVLLPPERGGFKDPPPPLNIDVPKTSQVGQGASN